MADFNRRRALYPSNARPARSISPSDMRTGLREFAVHAIGLVPAELSTIVEPSGLGHGQVAVLLGVGMVYDDEDVLFALLIPPFGSQKIRHRCSPEAARPSSS